MLYFKIRFDRFSIRRGGKCIYEGKIGLNFLGLKYKYKGFDFVLSYKGVFIFIFKCYFYNLKLKV